MDGELLYFDGDRVTDAATDRIYPHFRHAQAASGGDGHDSRDKAVMAWEHGTCKEPSPRLAQAGLPAEAAQR
jgi:hypothetical protein